MGWCVRVVNVTPVVAHTNSVFGITLFSHTDGNPKIATSTVKQPCTTILLYMYVRMYVVPVHIPVLLRMVVHFQISQLFK